MKKITVPKIISLAGLAAAGFSTSFLSSCGGNNITEAHIVSINDLHGAVAGVGDPDYCASPKNPGVQRLIKPISDILNKYPGSIFVSAGDNNSGDTFSTSTKGETLYPILRAMGIQYSAVGNHAFEWGLEGCKYFDTWARTDETQGNYFVSSNILNFNTWQQHVWHYHKTEPEFLDDYALWKSQRVSWADPWKIVDLNGHFVCLIGLTTQKTLEDGNRDVVNQLSLIDYPAAIAYSKYDLYDTIGETWYNKIEAFVLLTHIDSGENATTHVPEGEAINLAATTDINFDAIISAHSHQVGSWEVYNRYFDKTIPVGQAGTAGRYFLDTKLEFDNSKHLGQRLKKITMAPQKVAIDYGGHDISSKDDKEVQLAIAAATEEYKKILERGPTNSRSAKTFAEFTTQKEKVDEKLSYSIGTITMDLPYNAYDGHGANLGHKYYIDELVNEPMGAFANMAVLEGFRRYLIDEKLTDEYPFPAISFMNQDSLTASYHITKGSYKTLTRKAYFDMQPHDNSTYIGYITVDQLWNIVNYMLAGEQMFSYQKNNYYEKTELDKDLVHKESETYKDLKTNSKFLCGPMCFYGFTVQIKEDTSGSTYDRRYCVDYEEKEIDGTKVNVPKMTIYDPSSQNQSLEDPKTWSSAEDWLKKEKEGSPAIPCITNSFVYDAGNGQTGMVKPYFDITNIKWGHKTQHLSLLTRDWIERYCDFMNKQHKPLNNKLNICFDETLGEDFCPLVWPHITKK